MNLRFNETPEQTTQDLLRSTRRRLISRPKVVKTVSNLAQQWRNHTITQFSVVISLLITLGVAALGFSANLLRDEHFRLLLSEAKGMTFTPL